MVKLFKLILILNIVSIGHLHACESAALWQDSVDVILARNPSVPAQDSGARVISNAAPGVALALSGGGARGIAHIGVLKALVEADVPICGIAGTSIGAIIGGLFSAGYSIAELEEMANSIEWSDVLLDAPARKSLPLSRKSTQSIALLELRFDGVRPYIPSALTAGQKLSSLLVDRVNRAPFRGEPDFDHLKVPFIAVCTDLNTGERVLFREGDLAEAIFASMALPLLIAPVNYRDKLLIDGGVAENIPVYAAREVGDFVVAVDVTMPPSLGSPPFEPWVIANQVTGLMQEKRNRELLAAADFVITPLPDTLSTFSFTEPGLLLDMGYRATMAQIDVLKEEIDLSLGSRDTTTIPAKRLILKAPHFSVSDSLFSAYHALGSGRLPTRAEIIRDLEMCRQDPEIRSAQAEIADSTLIYELQPDPLVTSVELSGVTQLDTFYLRTVLTDGFRDNPGLRLSHLQLDRLLDAYRRAGNPLAIIKAVDCDEQGRVKIQVDEAKILAIHTEGLHRVSAGRLLRDFSIKEGEPLNILDLNLGIEESYGSDLFNIVRATIVDNVVTIKVQERPSPRLRLGAGVDSERHGRGLMELSHESVPVLGGSIRAWLKYGELDERYELTYRNLAILKTYMEGSGSVISSRTEYHYFDNSGQSQGQYHFDRLAAAVHLGQQFHTWGRIVFGFSASRIRGDYRNAPPELQLRKFFLRSEMDTQDRNDFPSNGMRYDFHLEAAIPGLGGDVAYSRMQIRLSRALPITRRITFLGNVKGGLCDQATPFPEWFRLGGETSFYGLHQDELAGRQFFSLSLEMREDLLSRFLADSYVSIRGDVGALWEEQEAEISSEDFMQSLGISLELDTFLGPMSLSYGYLFPKRDSSRRQLLYFNVGHRF